MIQQHFQDVRYYDFKKHWTKTIKPIMESPQAKMILDRDFEHYINVKRANYVEYAMSKGLSTTEHGWYFTQGCLPADYDSCDWRHGRLPAWNKYVCHGACHWIVNTLLYVAMTAYPNQTWRIVSSPQHSTVWDGENILFDLNYLTIGVSVEECVNIAFMNNETVILNVGEYLALGRNYY
jgi:hypothetical protein